VSQSSILNPSVFATLPALLSTFISFTSSGLVVGSDDSDDNAADDDADSKFYLSSAISFYH